MRTTEGIVHAMKTALGIFTPKINAGGWLTGAASVVALAIGAGNLLFFYVVLVLFVLDLLVGMGAAVRDPHDRFDPVKLYSGVVGKLMRFALIVLGAAIDWSLIGLARTAGADGLQAQLAAGMPVVKAALVLLVVAEGTSIARKVQASEGGPVAAITDMLIAALGRIKAPPADRDAGGEP